MKKRRLILLAFGLIAAVVLTIFAWPGEREPEYQGKKLSEWLHGPLTTPDPDFGFPNEQEVDAVRHIGTNAIPCLLTWMHHRSSNARDKMDAAAAKLPWGLADSRIISWAAKDRGSSRAKAASAAFIILGSQAAPAVPELARLGASEDSSEGTCALQALASIGQPALPAILSAVGDVRHPNRQSAMGFLYGMKANGVDVSPAVSILTNCLTERDSLIAGSAATSLGNLHVAPGVSVPALGRSLHDARLLVRYLSARALAEFVDEARPVVPELVVCLTDSEADMRLAVTNALQRIMPDVLPREAREWQPIADGGTHEIIPLWLRDLTNSRRLIRVNATNMLRGIPTNFFPKPGP